MVIRTCTGPYTWGSCPEDTGGSAPLLHNADGTWKHFKWLEECCHVEDLVHLHTEK